MHQLCKATEPQQNWEKQKCAVYGCESKPEMVVRIGGGDSPTFSTQSTSALCRSHGFELRDSLNDILHEGDDRMVKCQGCSHWDWKIAMNEVQVHNPDGPDHVVYYCGSCV